MADSPNRPKARVVILTALDVEYTAVRTHLVGDLTVTKVSGGTLYELGTFAGETIDWTVAVAEIGEGNESTAIEATKAIGELKPDLLMFVGVAGSLKPADAPHGSVVVASSVYGYQFGKDSEEFSARPVVFRTWHGLSQLVKLVRRGDWAGAEAPAVLVRPIAAGNVLVGSSKSKTYELIRRYYNDATAVEMESVGLYLAADRAERLPVLSIRGISDCVDDKTAGADVEWQPVASVNAADFAFAMLNAIRPDDIHSPLQGPEDSPAPEARQWASVPSSSAEELQRASESHQAAAAKLLSLLAAGQSDPRATASTLLCTPPRWLFDADSGFLWAAIGEFAIANGLHESAVDAFRKAAQAGGDSGTWLALAALELSQYEDAEKALAELSEAPSGSTGLTIPLTRALIERDTHGVLHATEGADGTDLRASAYRVQALRIEGRVLEAVDLAERLVEYHPGAAGSLLILADLLMECAQQDASPLGYEGSLLRARELALAARDLRRGWRGDSTEGALLAGRASIMLDDAIAALRVSSEPDEGSALPPEAANDSVRQVRVDALIFLGRGEDALTEAERITDEVKRKLVQADCLRALGRDERAEALYSEAVEVLGSEPLGDSEQVTQLFQGLLGLADLGVTVLPHIERLRVVSPDAATKVEVVSDIARGKTKEAIQRARNSGTPGHVGLLVQALVKAGQTDDAVSVLKDAASRIGRNDYLLQAVLLLARAHRFSEALKEAVEALAVVADGTPLKNRLRVAAVESAAMIPDWDAMRRQAKAAVAAGDTSDDMRWELVLALHNTLSPEDALREATAVPVLKPRSEQEARLLIALHSLRGEGLESIATVLDAAEAFPESEEIGAAAVTSVLMLSKALELPEDMRERFQKASDGFFERHPDSERLWRMEATPDRIFEFLEASGDPWNVPVVKDIVEQIGDGTLPLAMLTATSGKSYLELLVRHATGWLVGASLDPVMQERERGIALESIGHSVVVETSAVFGAMISGLPLEALLRLFSQTVVAQVAVADAIRGASDLSLRSTASMRWDSLRGGPVLDQTAPEEADRWAQEAEEVERSLRDSTPKAAVGRVEEAAKFPLVLEPAQIAKELGLALYSDDVAIRLIAASEGVPAFGTASLLAAAEEHDLLTAEQVGAAMDSMRRNRYADLDWSAEDLLRVAELEQFEPAGGAAGALARRTLWSDPVKASDAYRTLLARLVETDNRPELLEGWHAAATFGFLRSLDTGARDLAGGSLLAAAFLVLNLMPAALPPLLRGARAAAASTGAGDPLPGFCRGLIKALVGPFGEAQGGRMYAEMMQELESEDRAVARRELFTRKEPEAKTGA